MMPVIITTYDIIINDRVHLTNLNYNLIVTDEAHRLKNFECKLIQELKCYNSSNRLLLTGTPLHVSWLLLLFISSPLPGSSADAVSCVEQSE